MIINILINKILLLLPCYFDSPHLHPTTKKTISFRNGSLLFNLQYLGQIFIKSNNQGQFRNPQDELISKLSLLARFDKDLAEILEVEEKASISKSYHFFCRQV